jgi:hypothetical protein
VRREGPELVPRWSRGRALSTVESSRTPRTGSRRSRSEARLGS